MMNSDRKLIVLLLTTIFIALGGLAPVSAANAALVSSAQTAKPAALVAPYPFVFLNGNTRQRTDVLTAIAGTSFDYSRIGRTITVEWVNGLYRSGAYGKFSGTRILLDSHLRGERAGQVFTAEAWHGVDNYVITAEDRQALMAVAHGGAVDGHKWWETVYRDSLAETLMDSFISSYTAYPPTGLYWTHPATPELAAELRRVLL